MLYVRRRRGHGNVAEAFDKGFEAALEFAATQDFDQLLSAAETTMHKKLGSGPHWTSTRACGKAWTAAYTQAPLV